MLFAFYLVWGLIFGYFCNSLNVILIKKGASYSSLSQLSLISYPFALKFVFSPLVDAYYIKLLGKHKTYIVISNYIMSGLLVLFAFFIEDWINNLEITKITAVGFFLIFFLSFQCNAADAWPPSLLRPENLKYVGFIANFAQMFGMVVAYNLFIWLNSSSFCNKYLYSSPQSTGVLSNFWMMIALSVFTFSVAFLTQIFKKESQVSKQELASCKELMRILSRFWTNPNVRMLIFVVSFIGVGLQPIENGYVILLRKGLSQNKLSLVDLCSNLVATVAGVLGSYLASRRREFSYIMILLGFNVVLYSCYYVFIKFFEEIYEDLALGLLIMEDTLSGVSQSLRLVLFISFVLRNADEKIPAIYTTFFYSLYGFNNLWTISLSLLLIDYVDYTVLVWTGIAIAVSFLVVFGKKIAEMEKVEKKMWLVCE